MRQTDVAVVGAGLAGSVTAAMLARAQEAFRRDLPAFDASALQGASLESMTRDPAALRGEIERLTTLATRQEVIGGRTMKAIMSPMKDENGRRLGTVLEWFDRTQEVATESELKGVIAAVTAGNLSDRISLDGKRDCRRDVVVVHELRARIGLTESMTEPSGERPRE